MRSAKGKGVGGVAAPRAAMMRLLSSQNYKGGSNIADSSFATNAMDER